ncbi:MULTISPECIES: Na+/H+ antiporter NhaC family protein [Halobacterium]|uniref:arginine/ornithine antiporter ArcD n=1 Tax=Halobacterium TaxID=2239 RepID=UPI00159EF143|nr:MULTISPECIES: Na+/H+ antiporter NhaC family protein [Halobacterium]MCF2164971.1 Na+/H+ antiporter NhaC family protein [Halobacterium salinarum]MCF2168450.1 Na+/H+ antiporter NhaC family protein [Halobacterium salinarum]MCF2237662.1 Na+/H+ antiporter NhaC family protein [Halobacterium salinarum]QRY21714.1 Na+/H+ antiporter NhaC family protein [Halobacterium sp. GSL-19]WJK64854.1 Na+/H+ antiporter NhaC family protein [Halobacterium salinarum]
MADFEPKSYEDFDPEQRPSLGEALLPIAGMITFLAIGIVYLDLGAQMPLLWGIAFIGLIARYSWGYSWDELFDGISNSIVMGLGAIFILFIIYMLISSLVDAGTIPFIMYWGLDLLSPSVFVPITAVLSFVVATAIGSSWTTAGSLGLALVGIGSGLGIPEPLTAGAILSGAYMGDKQSPLSDTTLLASGVSNVDLWDHVRGMFPNTIIVGVISLALYTVLGLTTETGGAAGAVGRVAEIQGALAGSYELSVLVLLPLVITFGLAIAGYPALPSLGAGVFSGAAVSILVQGRGFAEAWQIIYSGTDPSTSVDLVTALLQTGGLEGSIGVVTIVFGALSIGGLLEATGVLAVLARNTAKAVGSIGGATLATAVGPLMMNVLTADQYMSIVVPGMTFRDLNDEYDLDGTSLSRTLEETGTVSEPMIPWNSGGVFMSATLGVPVLSYLPYYFVGILSPILVVIMGFTGWKMYMKDPEESPEESADTAA